ncbi:hypothetical protein [Pseudomonas sp. 2FE]|uniref:hypothetical protein n=1 Tax=Pseudomonas sp. 2FE TaxID=2502190 RepID=UPI0010FA1A8E|nr:hypothetical protein [Pseudomonas sp. 2FE]
MEKIDDKISNTSKESIFAKIFWITFTPLLGVFGYSAIYLIGVVYHQTWVTHFSVGASFFEKSTTDYFIYAYTALIHICGNWLNVLADPWIVLSTLGTVAFLVAEIVLLIWLSRPNNTPSANSIFSKNKKLGILIAITALSTSITLILLLLPAAANLFLITPAYTGYKAAQLSIEKNMPTYSLGCEKVEKRQDYCVRLLDGDIEIARGFVIDSSSERIALYLDGKATILPLKDYRIETLIPPPNPPNAQAAR